MDLPTNVSKWLEDNGAEFHAGYHRKRDPLKGTSRPGVMTASIIDKRNGLVWAKAEGNDKVDAIEKAILVASRKARPIRDGGISTDTNELRDEVAELRERLKKYETPAAEPKKPRASSAKKGKGGTKVFDDEDPNQDPGGPEGLTKEQAAALLAD